MKQAVLFKAVGGQLKTHLSLSLKETTTYNELREQVLRWDRGQQKWAGLIIPDDNGPAPMEISQLWEKGKGKQKGKGKGKNDMKGQKGKGKGKQKGKDGKGYGNSKGKGKDGKGKQSYGGGKQDGSKGKASGKGCYICGKMGHQARDCWQVRNVTSDGQQEQQQPPQQQGGGSVAGSPMSASSGASPNHGPVSQATQYRVARIQEEPEHCYDVSRHDDVVFDLRDQSPDMSPVRKINVISYYIGDEPSLEAQEIQMSTVRAVVDCMDDDSSLCAILLDSGADSSVFSLSMSGAGSASFQAPSKLQDAQGRCSPVHGFMVCVM